MNRSPIGESCATMRDMGDRKLRRGLGLVTRVGPRELFRVGLRLLWSTSLSFGLLVDLEEPLKRPHPARIPVIMEVYDPGSFTGFKEELPRVSGANSVEVSGRQEFCDGGVRSLYVSVDEPLRIERAAGLVDGDVQRPDAAVAELLAAADLDGVRP